MSASNYRVTPRKGTAHPSMTGHPIRTVRVPDDAWADARRVAAERGESVSAVIRRLLAEYVDDHDGTV